MKSESKQDIKNKRKPEGWANGLLILFAIMLLAALGFNITGHETMAIYSFIAAMAAIVVYCGCGGDSRIERLDDDVGGCECFERGT